MSAEDVLLELAPFLEKIRTASAHVASYLPSDACVPDRQRGLEDASTKSTGHLERQHLFTVSGSPLVRRTRTSPLPSGKEEDFVSTDHQRCVTQHRHRARLSSRRASVEELPDNVLDTVMQCLATEDLKWASRLGTLSRRTLRSFNTVLQNNKDWAQQVCNAEASGFGVACDQHTCNCNASYVCEGDLYYVNLKVRTSHLRKLRRALGALLSKFFVCFNVHCTCCQCHSAWKTVEALWLRSVREEFYVLVLPIQFEMLY